jgi:hypothetical protein
MSEHAARRPGLRAGARPLLSGAGVGLAAAVAFGSASGCQTDQGAAALHARQSALEREVEGLRVSVAKLERGEPILPEDAVVVSVSESIVAEFLAAQLPFEAETDKFKVKLTHGEAVFRGSPAVRLTGSIWRPDNPNLVGEVRAQGALEKIRVEPETGTLRATVALDHVDLVRMAGLEKFIAGGSLNELARTVRLQIEPRLPAIQIPVRIEQAVELPSVTNGPVRIQAARMPLEVSVADVLAGRGVLWVAVRVVPGEMTKVAAGPAPASGSGR